MIRFGRVVKNGFTAEDIFAYFSDNGVIHATNMRPSVSGDGISSQIVFHSPAHGKVEEAMKV
ncbi:hypothetical protein [Bathymodiolus japonicus methanotrophic gill symbiont]|uniref:hypothetical protein n=1 Tax=Bathymodiolus japonicus methanotrophic gill symbiont TaxID=113269 RepID=UPI001E53596C|nr:hypothetical protein [Bathymodiolus japonicus methanotrophic gill symbiont]